MKPGCSAQMYTEVLTRNFARISYRNTTKGAATSTQIECLYYASIWAFTDQCLWHSLLHYSLSSLNIFNLSCMFISMSILYDSIYLSFFLFLCVSFHFHFHCALRFSPAHTVQWQLQPAELSSRFNAVWPAAVACGLCQSNASALWTQSPHAACVAT